MLTGTTFVHYVATVGECVDVEKDILTEETCSEYGFYWNFTNNWCQESETSYCNQIDAADCLLRQGGWMFDWDTCQCYCNSTCQGSPILVDVSGDGFGLTDTAGGVMFDLQNDSQPETVVLDRREFR